MINTFFKTVIYPHWIIHWRFTGRSLDASEDCEISCPRLNNIDPWGFQFSEFFMIGAVSGPLGHHFCSFRRAAAQKQIFTMTWCEALSLNFVNYRPFGEIPPSNESVDVFGIKCSCWTVLSSICTKLRFTHCLFSCKHSFLMILVSLLRERDLKLWCITSPC